MFNERGQAAIELIITAVVLVGLVLGMATVMTQRNIETNRISEVQRSNVACQVLSAIITRLSASTSYMEIELMPLETRAQIRNGAVLIERVEGGNTICRYGGKAWLQTDAVTFEEDTPNGFFLERLDGGQSITYKVKKLGRGVVFCDTTWC